MTSIQRISTQTVADIMTQNVESLSPGDTIKEAARLMLNSGLSTIPVVDGHDQCVGVLSRNDLTEMFLNEDNELSKALHSDRLSDEWLNRSVETSQTRLVKELMNYEVITIERNHSISAACQLMVDSQIHHLPVVDEQDRVIGILSTFDVIQSVAAA